MRIAAKARRTIISAAERELARTEADTGHLDAVTELGCVLYRPIPKGEAFIEWIADDETQALCIAALLGQGFTWEEIRQAFFDLTHWRWLPSVEQLQHLYAQIETDWSKDKQGRWQAPEPPADEPLRIEL